MTRSSVVLQGIQARQRDCQHYGFEPLRERSPYVERARTAARMGGLAGQPRSGYFRRAALLAIAAVAACALPPVDESPTSWQALEPEFRSNAAQWEVLERNVGAGKIHDFQFGGYTIASGEIGARTGKTTRTHLALQKSRRVVTDYSFILQGAGTSTASVTATQTAEVTWHTLLEFLPGLYVGPAGGGVEYSSDSDEDEAERCWESDEDCWDDDDGQKRVKSSISERLVAKIDVTGAASASWQLSLDANRSGTLSELEVRAGSLTDGNRQIAIAPSTVVERSDGRPTWAYRFVEGGTTLAVLEFGDRVQSVVWMRQELPDDTQLMLAAAMTAILQGQATTP